MWCLRKRLRKWGSERMLPQRLHTADARGREDGFGGRRTRISIRRLSSPSTLDTEPAPLTTKRRSLLPSTRGELGMGQALAQKRNLINKHTYANQGSCQNQTHICMHIHPSYHSIHKVVDCAKKKRERKRMGNLTLGLGEPQQDTSSSYHSTFSCAPPLLFLRQE